MSVLPAGLSFTTKAFFPPLSLDCNGRCRGKFCDVVEPVTKAAPVASSAIPYAHAAALLAAHLLAVLSLAALGGDLFSLGIHLRGPLLWLTFGITAVSLLACLWDPEARFLGLPVAPLYVLGLAAVGLGLHQWELQPRELARTAIPRSVCICAWSVTP